MDIEGGSQTGFVSFLSALRALMDGGSKPYVVLQAFDLLSNSLFIGTTSLRVRFLILHTMTITNTVRFISASMSFPDAYIGTTLNEFGFDAVYVQFCE